MNCLGRGLEDVVAALPRELVVTGTGDYNKVSADPLFPACILPAERVVAAARPGRIVCEPIISRQHAMARIHSFFPALSRFTLLIVHLRQISHRITQSTTPSQPRTPSRLLIHPIHRLTKMSSAPGLATATSSIIVPSRYPLQDNGLMDASEANRDTHHRPLPLDMPLVYPRERWVDGASPCRLLLVCRQPRYVFCFPLAPPPSVQGCISGITIADLLLLASGQYIWRSCNGVWLTRRI